MGSRLTATVLVENTPAEGLRSEHGLSVHVRYGQLRLLLDFGQSDAFAHNAEVLGIDLATVDHAVLSHAHHDHANGMAAFFARNGRAPLHLSEACAENCWSSKGGTVPPHYIGIRPGLLVQYAERLSPASPDGTTTIAPGVHLVPHATGGLTELGERAGMLLHEGGAWLPDGFAHETSLVFELDAREPGGMLELAVFSSCSHAGLPIIASEVRAAFPGAHIAAYVGGLHLMRSADGDILQVAEAIRAVGIGHVHTGHCTGGRAVELLARELPGRVGALRPGLALTL
ncbi:MAG: MBL fold metallo-hydrolase [Acidobacteriota bacterium]|nr:MBL fold metallo-hydrolase [Acidobacteriota bacterium]